MNAKHTPGAWHCIGRTVYALDETATCIRFSALIEGGCTVHTRIKRERTSPLELDSNARLIAAAPDLLEALEEYLQAGHKEARRIASIKAKSALAKAKGEKP